MKMDDEKNLITIREAFEIWVKVFYPNDFSKDRFKPEPDKVRPAQFQYDSRTGEHIQPAEIVDSEEEIGDRFFDLGGLATLSHGVTSRSERLSQSCDLIGKNLTESLRLNGRAGKRKKDQFRDR